MRTLKIHDFLKRRVLVTRDSARAIQAELKAALIDGQGQVTLDFDGVDGLTPSFLDEILSIIEESTGGKSRSRLQITVTNPPTQLSSKFAAVGRGHGLAIKESDHTSWIISAEATVSSPGRSDS